MGKKKEINENTEKENFLTKIKAEAKSYYKDKNMIVRYIFLLFIVLILISWVIIPHKKNIRQNYLENINDKEIENVNSFMFLGDEIVINKMDSIQNLYFNIAIQNILSKNFTNIYNLSQLYIPQVQNILKDYDVPVDFSYLLLNEYIKNNIEYPMWRLSELTWKDLGLTINDDVSDVFNIKKSTEFIAKYFNDLYDEFGDWRLVMAVYGLGYDELKQEIKNQGTRNFDELYLIWPEDLYNTTMGYSYLYQNIDEYVDDIDLYESIKTKTISVGEIKNIKKRSDKNGYSYKEIRELNPRILGNKLPKGRREILVIK